MTEKKGRDGKERKENKWTTRKGKGSKNGGHLGMWDGGVRTKERGNDSQGWSICVSC